MKKYLKENISIIISFLILLTPIFTKFNMINIYSLGVLLLLFFLNIINKKKDLLSLILLIIYSSINYLNPDKIFNIESNLILLTFYFILIFSLFYNLKDYYKISDNTYLLFFLIYVVLSFIFKINISDYYLMITLMIFLFIKNYFKSIIRLYIPYIYFLLLITINFNLDILTYSNIIMLGTYLFILSNKKDLLFLANTMTIGGIEKSLLNLVNRINLDKYNVTILLESKEGDLLEKINSNIIIKELRVSNYPNKYIRKLINLTNKIIFFIFNGYKYDYSCCFATYSYSSNILSLISSQNNSIYVHSDYTNLYNDSEFKNFFDTRSIHKFKNILVVSNEIKEGLLKHYNLNNIRVINNFINPEEIISLSKKKKIKKETTTLLFIGRLDDSSKKLGRMINIVKNIKDLNLWIVGDGPSSKMYKDLVKTEKLQNRVHFFGSKDNPYPYLKECDYLILTSDYEGFPVTFLEALVLNKKIITTLFVSDENIDIKEYAYLISKDDNAYREVVKILKDKKKIKYPDFNLLQKKKMIMLEKIFEGAENA